MYQFADTFDHYNTAFLTAQKLYETVGGAPVVSASYARFPAISGFPSQGLYLPYNAYVRKNLKSNQPTLIAFMTFGIVALAATQMIPVLSLLDNGTLQIVLGVTPTGALQFYKYVPGFNPVLLGPSSALGLIAPTSLPVHGIEIAVTFSATVGTVQCWLDGAVVIPLTGGLNTIETANAYANQVNLGESPSNAQGSGIYTDYVRVWDATGSYQNAPVGFDCRKLTKLPSGAGVYTQWTPNGAANNWQCVDESSPDSDTTYVSSNGNNYDSYSMPASGLLGLPSMVVSKSFARKDDGATRALEVGVLSGASLGLGSPFTLGSTYQWVDACISLDPATGLPPTAAAVDAYQFLKYEST